MLLLPVSTGGIVAMQGVLQAKKEPGVETTPGS